jgi:hypothetical protein
MTKNKEKGMCYHWIFFFEVLLIAQCHNIYKNTNKIIYIIDSTTILDHIKDNQNQKSLYKKVFY